MSRSGWLKHFKTGLTLLAVIVAITLGLSAIRDGLSRDAEYQREADQNSREDAAYTEQQIRKDCIPLADQAEAYCIAEKRDEYRKDRRDERDLVAQRKSANWAYIMGAAAVLGMILSAVGVILVWVTFRETKRTADQAIEANKISRHGLEVHFDTEGGVYIWSGNRNPPHAYVIMEVRNKGMSRADRLTMTCEFEISDGVFPRSKLPLDFGGPLVNLIPEASVAFRYGESALAFDPDKIRSCDGKTATAWFTISFTNIFGEPVTEYRTFAGKLQLGVPVVDGVERPQVKTVEGFHWIG